jgi:hypothetical protein
VTFFATTSSSPILSLALNFEMNDVPQRECDVIPTLRMVGPTRASEVGDLLGNSLGLTKRHPYALTPQEMTAIKFNSKK